MNKMNFQDLSENSMRFEVMLHLIKEREVDYEICSGWIRASERNYNLN